MLEGNVKPFVELGALPAMKATISPAAEGLQAKKSGPSRAALTTCGGDRAQRMRQAVTGSV